MSPLSKYIMHNGTFYDADELQHAWLGKGKKAEKHKYIKREWKNGRWQYYYDNDTSAKPTNQTNKSKLRSYLDGVKRDWTESKLRGTKKAVEEATAHDGSFIVGKGGIRELANTTFTDSKDLLSGTTSLIIGGKTEIRQIRRGKLERFVDTAKEYIKDRLGYDERDEFKEASAKYDYAKRAEKNYQDTTAAEINFMGTADPTTGKVKYTDNQKKKIEEIERNQKLLRRETDRAEKDASEAAEAYLNTPLAKVEAVRKAGEEWLEQIFGRKRKK